LCRGCVGHRVSTSSGSASISELTARDILLVYFFELVIGINANDRPICAAAASRLRAPDLDGLF